MYHMLLFLVTKDKCFFGPCDTFPTCSFWPFKSSHRVFFLLQASPSCYPWLYFFFMHLIAVLWFMWYISYIPYLIPCYLFLFYYLWHSYCFLDENLSGYVRPMFFGTCGTFPTFSFWPFNSSHRFFILLHYSPSSAPSLYIFFMHLYAVLLFMWYISYFPNLIPCFFPLFYYCWHSYFFFE